MNGVKFTVLLEGFGTPFVFEVDAERVEGVKIELARRQGWSDGFLSIVRQTTDY